MDDEQKIRIHERVHRAVHDVVSGSAHGACLYYAFHGRKILDTLGICACVQAGSAYWTRDPEDPFTGAFGYEWSPTTSLSRLSMFRKCLPEMHIWLGIVESQEVIDFAAGHFVEQAKRRGFDWPGSKPPPFLWCPVHELSPGAAYILESEATIFAGRLLQELERDYDGFG